MKEVDYIIIFGCHIKRKLNKRLYYFSKYKNNYKYNYIFLSGGIGRFGNYNESIYMKEYLLKDNIDENKIIIEDKSATTNENIINMINILKLNDKNNKYRIVLITNNIHMFRIKNKLNKLLNNSNLIIEYNVVK